MKPLRLPTAVAVDLDDTLNDFTATLNGASFPYDKAYALPEATFHAYLAKVRLNEPESGGLQSTKYTFFRSKIHERCYRAAQPRADGVEFMRWLRQHGCRIVICTQRDLRRANGLTRTWLRENGVPFDYLFMALNKIVFCNVWGIRHLVDDEEFNSVHGGRYGVNVYYPIGGKERTAAAPGARGFHSYDEVKQWIQE